MKKVKIMLLSLLVLAVAGGAMAFNAKFSNSFCTIATVNGVCPTNPSSCPIVKKVKLTTAIGTPVCYTSDLGAGNCAGITSCTFLTTTITNQ